QHECAKRWQLAVIAYHSALLFDDNLDSSLKRRKVIVARLNNCVCRLQRQVIEDIIKNKKFTEQHAKELEIVGKAIPISYTSDWDSMFQRLKNESLKVIENFKDLPEAKNLIQL